MTTLLLFLLTLSPFTLVDNVFTHSFRFIDYIKKNQKQKVMITTLYTYQEKKENTYIVSRERKTRPGRRLKSVRSILSPPPHLPNSWSNYHMTVGRVKNNTVRIQRIRRRFEVQLLLCCGHCEMYKG